MNTASTPSAPQPAAPDTLRFLLIDDHPLFRDALRSTVNTLFPGATTDDAHSLDDALKVLDADDPFDLALLDLNLPGVQGFDGLLRLRKTHPRLPILVVSGLEDNPTIRKSLQCGAAGFVPKSVGRDQLSLAIDQVISGSVYTPPDYEPDAVSPAVESEDELMVRLASLTPQQLRVLVMLREGMLNKQIAHELGVGSTTVKAHVSEVLRKLKVHSRTQAVIEASRVDFSELNRDV